MSSVIRGTGAYLPERVVTNDDLARLMDTSNEWILRRTGVAERHIAAEEQGAADLGALAGAGALTDAGLSPREVDALIVATMTPDYFAPGSAPIVQDRIGLRDVPAYDISQQCSGFLYGLDLADGLISSARAETVLVVGTEVHTMFQPWAGQLRPLLERGIEPTPGEYAYNTRFRDWSVLFGDGAGAMVVGASSTDDGWQGARLRTDGSLFDLISVPGVGSRARPYVSGDDVAKDLHMPVMSGGRLFRNAVRLMPEAVGALLEEKDLTVDDVALVVAHQANGRIIDAVAGSLGLAADKVPKNLDRYGNTTAASIPILYHELRTGGRIRGGDLVCFVAFGAGAHWGAGLYREPC